jgi:hypothetical protein
MYAATTRDEGNATDGLFSAACKTVNFFSTFKERVLFSFSHIPNAMPHP